MSHPSQTRNRATSALLSLPFLGLAFVPVTGFAQAPSDLAQLDFFEKNIRPVLANSCYECHSADSKKLRGGLLVDTREGLLRGGDSGPALVPGNPEKSLLIASIRHEHKDPDMAMPPKKEKLPAAVLANFEAWVKMGAPDPRSGGALSKAAAWDAAKAADHWAFKPVSNPPIPKVADPQKFAQNPVDSFVLAKLAQNKLAPSPKADKQTLIRRVTYDLTGLPPSPAEVEAFLADNSPDAYVKLVDRLLASPRYGERWARHWLDIARYADTTGDRQIGRLRPAIYSHAWTYRDYVIKAFNSDLPYDQFLIEQIAADKLPESKEDKSKLAALGFLTVGKRFMGNDNDVIDDRIDVVTKGLMGLTGACARCHDHKFDPVPTKDYYSLHGIFASSEEPTVAPALLDPEANPAYKDYLAEIAKVDAEVKAFERGETLRLAVGMLEQAGDYLLAVHDSNKSEDTTKKGSNFRLAARNKGLKAELAAVWMDQVKLAEAAQKKKKDPTLAPWLALSALPAANFELGAMTALAGMAGSADYNQILVGMLIDKWPTSLADVAGVYTEALGALRQTLGLPEFTGRKAAKDPFNAAKVESPLADPVLEGLRKDVFAANSAMVPDERTAARTFGVTFTNAQAAFRGKVASIELAHPGAPMRAMTLVDKAKPRDSAVLIRGEPKNLGPIVPRRFLTLLGGDDSKPFTDGSGRLELARNIASRENPLTARVIANRVWQWHFGQAIVRTPSDFGTRSEAPTHPELLDWMATWLMDHNWSIKQLNKLIVTSATYQQESRPLDKAMASDPTNQWLWRFNIQRLDFEQVRDTLLAVSDHLETEEVGGRPFQLTGSSTTGAMAGKKRYAIDPTALTGSPNRRTVYAMIDRANLPEMFNTFDFANPEISTGERVLTTVPQQALFMMNSPFIAEQVRSLFERKDFPKAGSDEDKVRFIFRVALQRAPTGDEMASAQAFLSSDPKELVETNNLISPAAQAGSLGEKRGLKKAAAATPTPGTFRPLNTWERYAQVLLLTNELMYVR